MTMDDDTARKYPEHAKLTAVSGKSQTIGEFLDWLLNDSRNAKYRLCEHRIVSGIDEFVPTYISIEKLLGEYFGIDTVKINVEKEKMLQEVRVMNTLHDIEKIDEP